MYINFRKIHLFIFISFLLTGCAAGLDYNKLNAHMSGNECAEAIEYVKMSEPEYSGNDRLLFLLDSAMVNMLCYDHEKSNAYLHSAEELSRDLWTKSVSREAASFLINDYVKPYPGEDFEKALINLFSAINYANMGEFDDAMVEVRRLDTLLEELNREYADKNVYNEDAFGRYLSGIMYEIDGRLDDAYIDYFKSLEVFKDYRENYGTPVPRYLLEDISRIAGVVDRKEELDPLIAEFEDIEGPSQKETKEMGRVILIHFNGNSPVKTDEKIVLPAPDGPITLAFPAYSVQRPLCRESKLIAEAGPSYKEADAELVEDINEIAVKNLEDRRVRVVVKMLARAAVKRAVIDSATEEDTGGEELLNIMNVFIEQADTRTWRTLPGEIYLSRMFLPEGDYDLYVTQCDGEKKAIKSLSLRAGETRFILYESMY